jgi:hypothetical protein
LCKPPYECTDIGPMIIYQNRHWIVDDQGMRPTEPRGGYHILYRTIFDKRGSGPDAPFDWPLHMAEKTWVDIGTFNEAFCTAVRYYSRLIGHALDEDHLRSSCDEAFRLAVRLRLGR